MFNVLQGIFYIILIFAVALFAMNQWRLWKHPYLFKGDTGPQGPDGVMGSPGVCYCDECNPALDNPKLREPERAWDEHRLTKEDAYGLPPVEPEY